MDISVGNIAYLKKDFVNLLGSSDEDGRFLITLVTDYAIALKALRSGERYTIRITDFIENLKWFEHPYVPSPLNTQPVDQQQQPPPPPPPPPPDQPFEVAYVGSGGLEFGLLYVAGVVTIVDDDPYNSDPY